MQTIVWYNEKLNQTEIFYKTKNEIMIKTKFKNFLSVLILILIIFSSCQNQDNTTNQPEINQQRNQVEENTKKLLDVFFDKENIEQLDLLVADSVKLHYPNKTVFDKAGLMKICKDLMQKHDNNTEIIDIVIEGNNAFVLFIWSGTVEQDNNPKIVGKEFSIHDCYRLTWKDGKIVEWYVIFGSMEYLTQIGYTFSPPSID